MRRESFVGADQAGLGTGSGYSINGDFVMKVDKSTVGSRRELVMMLKIAGTVAVVLSLIVGLFAAIDVRGEGMAVALPMFSLALQLFFAGMMMLAAAAGLEILSGLRESLTDDPIETRRYGRTRSNKGSLLAAKLAAEPVAH